MELDKETGESAIESPLHLEQQSNIALDDEETLKSALFSKGNDYTSLALILFGMTSTTVAGKFCTTACIIAIVGCVGVSSWMTISSLIDSQWTLLGASVAMLVKTIVTSIAAYEVALQLCGSFHNGYCIEEDGMHIWTQSLSESFIPMCLIFSPLIAAIIGTISLLCITNPAPWLVIAIVGIFSSSWVLAAYTSVVLWFIVANSQRSLQYVNHLHTLLSTRRLSVPDYHDVCNKIIGISQSCRWGVSYLLPTVLIDAIGGICLALIASHDWFNRLPPTTVTVVLASTLAWFLLTLVVADITFLTVLLLRLANVNDRAKQFALAVVEYSSSSAYNNQQDSRVSSSAIQPASPSPLSVLDRHEILALCMWKPIGMNVFGTHFGKAAIMKRMAGLFVGVLVAVIKILLVGLAA